MSYPYALGRADVLRGLIERKYPQERMGLAEITSWLLECDDEDMDWVFDHASTDTFTDLKAGLEKRLKTRGAL